MDIDMDIDHEINLLVNKHKYYVPETYKQALKSPQAKQWQQACKEEIQSFKDNQVYQSIHIQNLKPGSPIVSGRWVFSVKQEADNSERFKLD